LATDGAALRRCQQRIIRSLELLPLIQTVPALLAISLPNALGAFADFFQFHPLLRSKNLKHACLTQGLELRHCGLRIGKILRALLD
jgi:hypothetical protein